MPRVCGLSVAQRQTSTRPRPLPLTVARSMWTPCVRVPAVLSCAAEGTCSRTTREVRRAILFHPRWITSAPLCRTRGALPFHFGFSLAYMFSCLIGVVVSSWNLSRFWNEFRTVLWLVPLPLALLAGPDLPGRPCPTFSSSRAQGVSGQGANALFRNSTGQLRCHRSRKDCSQRPRSLLKLSQGWLPHKLQRAGSPTQQTRPQAIKLDASVVAASLLPF